MLYSKWLVSNTDSLGPGKPERGKGTDIRIKLERPHDHESSSVSPTYSRYYDKLRLIQLHSTVFMSFALTLVVSALR